MKLGRLVIEGRSQLAIALGEQAIPLGPVLPQIGDDMVSLITHWDDLRAQVQAIAEAQRDILPVSNNDWKRPIERPGKILAIGLNYADHIAETGMQTPNNQMWFCKLSTSANDPFADVPLPIAGLQIDYEVELVAVIGKPGRHIAPENAAQHVFGYCVGNDVSVRDWQLASPQWVLGKSFDGHAPFGPYITVNSPDIDPHNLPIQASVNGEVRQNSNTRHLVFSLWDQIAHLSKAVTLEAGDIIFTGTPGGVGLAMQPPVYLKPGDRVRCQIGGLGYIENQFEPEAVNFDGP
jgi:2-keto-4-pentenoate hydratase/2-oxohepta-3-ene-1,7-dioic acid hydratase in catechol pathway